MTQQITKQVAFVNIVRSENLTSQVSDKLMEHNRYAKPFSPRRKLESAVDEAKANKEKAEALVAAERAEVRNSIRNMVNTS